MTDSAVQAPTVLVYLPHQLRAQVKGRRSIQASGNTVRELIDSLDAQFPGLRFNFCYETGDLRQFVRVYVDGEDVHYLQELDTPLTDSSTVHILHSVAGG
jgi:molybdopterin synthase sulfur carrier subunit